MIWKSDSIQDFVRFKIQHPQQSYQLLKNYHLEKKQNQQLQKMYKELQQLKTSKDYFFNELQKLRKITQNQGLKNQKQIIEIDNKNQIITKKLTDFKQKIKSQQKKNKSQIQIEYQQKIQSLQVSNQSELKFQEQQINQLNNQLEKLQDSKKKQEIQNKINKINQKIQLKKAEFGERLIKTKLMKSLEQKINDKNVSIQKKVNLLKSKKQQQEQIKKRKNQQQHELFQQMKQKIQETNLRIIEKIKFQLFQKLIEMSQKSPIKVNQFHQQRPNSMQQKSTTDNQISQQVLFNPHIDFSYTKKNKNSSPLKDSELKAQKVQLLQKQQTAEEIQKKINDFKQFIQNLRNERKATQSSSQKDIQESQKYLSTKFNYKADHLHNSLDLLIQQIKTKIKSDKLQNENYLSSENQKISSEQNILAKKQKELDKQIQHLHNKLQKTQQQITKKNRASI